MRIRLSELRSIVADEVVKALLEAPAPEVEKYAGLEADPYIAAALAAGDPKELAAAKRRYVKDDDAGRPTPSAGAFFHFHDRRKAELHALGSGPAVRGQADALLRTRDSSGRATPRKW